MACVIHPGNLPCSRGIPPGRTTRNLRMQRDYEPPFGYDPDEGHLMRVTELAECENCAKDPCWAYDEEGNLYCENCGEVEDGCECAAQPCAACLEKMQHMPNLLKQV